jgi:hypothetical protein
MRTVFVLATVSAFCVGFACGGAGENAPFGPGDDGGGGSSSGGGSGSSSGGSSSSSGSSSGGASSSSGGSSSGSGGSSGASSGSGSGGSSGGSSGCTTNTGPISGTVSATGGSISRLVFAVVGDTRPANEDDPSGYPTSVISKIYQDIEALSPHPPLVLNTGDYMFASTGSNSTASQQIDLYLQSRKLFTGADFPAMGNHECGVGSGCSSSNDCNCGPGNSGGVTANYTAFMDGMMKPLGQSHPYYSVNVNATDNSWTAKFVMTAANAWDSGQQSWLQGVMAQKTTYTFVVRHEASDAYPPLPPGVAGVDAVLAQYPYTMLIVGHTHDYGHYTSAPKVAVIGNGGAPLSSTKYDYGYGLFSQRCDGAIVADEINYNTGTADSYFHFVITPAGAITK